MYALRRWAVRNAGVLERAYAALEWGLKRLRPLARGIGYRRLERPAALVERAVKGALFDCKMCGACLLSRNGMSCPTNCPKGMRNGPCGGVRADGTCEVIAGMPCVWVEGWNGSQKMRHPHPLQVPNAALEHQDVGRSSWLRVMSEDPWPESLLTRTPVPANASSESHLETLLRAGVFVVTSECSPPDSADPADVTRALNHYDGYVDALNVTDAPSAHCHMSSIGVSAILARSGREPVMQMTCRDRNRIAIQGDILAAAALGIRNLLCLTGDGIASGDDPGAKPVFDLDAVTLLDTTRRLRDDGLYRSGRQLGSRPQMFLGAVDNPFVPPYELRPLRLEKKIIAGAQFVQTQYCFDVEMLERYMVRVRDARLHERCFILIGIGPLVSARTARWMRQRIPGIHIPDDVIRRLEQATDPEAEGMRMCIDNVRRIREIEGVAGIHLMAPRREHLIGDIVRAAGLREQRYATTRHEGGAA